MKYLTNVPATASHPVKLHRRVILQGSALTGIVAVLPACGAENSSTDTSTSSASTVPSPTAPAFTSDANSTTTSSATSSTTAAASPGVSSSAASETTSSPPSSAATPSSTSETSSSTAEEADSSSDVSQPTSGSSGETTTSAADSSSDAATDELTAPPWDDVPVCDASRTDAAGQGPFFIHDAEKDDDVSLYRQDIRGRYNQDAEPGTEMQLHLRILSSTADECNQQPVADVEVYIWHTDAQGFYSGFGDPGDQKPDEPYAGVPNQNDLNSPERFCRGAAITDANGVVSFRSIFPGWYNGRDVHIHFVALKRGSASRGRQTYSGSDHLFTTQFYFEPELTDSVHKSSEPYLRRTTLGAYQGAIQADEANNSGLRAKASFDGSVVVAQMQILLDPEV